MIFVIISSNHNLSATLLPQPFPPSSSPSSRLRCGVGCPLVDCRELSAAKAARCLNPPRAHHVGDWKQEMPSCFVFSGSTNRRSGFTIFLLIVDRFSESFVWGNLKTKQTRFARKRRANQNIPPSALVDSFLEQLQNLVLIFCWRLKNCRCSCGSWVFCRGGCPLFFCRALLDGLPELLMFCFQGKLTIERCEIVIVWNVLDLRREAGCQYQKDLFLNTQIDEHSKSLFINKEC